MKKSSFVEIYIQISAIHLFIELKLKDERKEEKVKLFKHKTTENCHDTQRLYTKLKQNKKKRLK